MAAAEEFVVETGRWGMSMDAVARRVELGGDNFCKRVPFPIDMDAIVPFHIQQSLRAIAGPNAERTHD